MEYEIVEKLSIAEEYNRLRHRMGWDGYDPGVIARALLSTAEEYAQMILRNGQQAIRSANETVQEIIGRSRDDALRLETLYGYSSVGDFKETKERLASFYAKGKSN